MERPASLTRDEAYALLDAIVTDRYFNGPTKTSSNLVMYIIERDVAEDHGTPAWPLPRETRDFPCAQALVTAMCPFHHDWRPLGVGLTYIPFGHGEE
jgi:hypothetical protein